MKNILDKDISAMLMVNKPQGITSHDVVNILREKLKIKRIGHTGTLDPMASGLLILLIGKATKKQKEFQEYSKIYSGKILFGLETDTWDMDGKILSENKNLKLDKEKVYNVIYLFSGTIIQQVPPYSAVKYKGQTLYKITRKNLKAPVIKRQVFVEWLYYKYADGELDFRIKCSSGTYIRSIAHQMGKVLCCGGVLKELKRESIGKFSLKDSYTLDEIKKTPNREIYKLFYRV